MSKAVPAPAIRLRGVRHNNLKGFDLDLPLNQLIVVTGPSGSGKSSLAFDTLFAEGQRRYIETFSPYARQFFDRMDKPRVDSIEGIPPAIAIEQRNAVRTTRSTVGTMTEICDYLKLLWPHLARLHCRGCGRPVTRDSPQAVWEAAAGEAPREPTSAREVLVTFDLALSGKLSLDESLALVAKQGYQRLLDIGSGDKPEPAAETRNPDSTSDPNRLTGCRAEAPGDALASCGGALELRDQPSALGEAARGNILAEVMRVEEAGRRLGSRQSAALTIIQDRLRLTPANRTRFIEACEQAYHFGKGRLAVHEILPTLGGPGLRLRTSRRFSNRLHCADCDIEYREPAPALFSFNHPLGACPKCRGFGRIILIDYNLAVPDRSRTLAEGVVKPWLSGMSRECQDDMMRFCRQLEIPTDVPFDQLPRYAQDWVIEGDPDYGKDKQHEWPGAWYGVKGYFRWLESKAYKMHVRVLLSRYRAYRTCPDCQGKRFQPEALWYRVTLREPLQPDGAATDPFTLADFYLLPIRDALEFIDRLARQRTFQPADPLSIVLADVRARLGYLVEVGLGYLTLDRATRTLSGGETERVNLTTCLGSRLVNTLFILDEPSVGLHARDTARLIRIVRGLRDAGNTVVVVEHEAAVMQAADRIVDLGPGHGESGGQVVFQGSYREILRARGTVTGDYLSRRKRIPLPERRAVALRADARGARTDALRIEGASLHNLKDLSVSIPLGRFVCVTGVSGSGKTTLVREILLPALEARLKSSAPAAADSGEEEAGGEDAGADAEFLTPHCRELTGWEALSRVVIVDQSPLGKTPRSNPAVYIGAFDHIREVFARTEVAQRRGLNASAFSFNSAQGQCERCRGAGFEKIEMQFLSDVFIRCPDCDGRRYRGHILEVKAPFAGKTSLPRDLSRPVDEPGSKAGGDAGAPRGKAGRSVQRKQGRGASASQTADGVSIADVLEMTVEDVVAWLGGLKESRPARQAASALALLQQVGLGYLRLGQPINTLSGGESQRLKLVSHLAEVQSGSPQRGKPILFLFDEPTTGLHFDDVRVLLQVFQRLVDAGHSVVVVEHNLDVIKSADWVIDLGPDAGDEGGRLVAEGTPEAVARHPASHTGTALRSWEPRLAS